MAVSEVDLGAEQDPLLMGAFNLVPERANGHRHLSVYEPPVPTIWPRPAVEPVSIMPPPVYNPRIDLNKMMTADEQGENVALRLYLNEVGRYQVPTHEQAVAMARRIHRGKHAKAELSVNSLLKFAGHDPGEIDNAEALIHDIAAGDQAFKDMFHSNLRLVVSIAKKFKVDGMTILDHIQNGSLGLNRAIEKFDPELGWKFSTYASNWIKQRIFLGVKNQARMIRLPAKMEENLSSLRKARIYLQGEGIYEPTVQQLVEQTGYSQKKIIRLLDGERTTKTISLNEPFKHINQGHSGMERFTLEDIIEDGDVDVEGEALDTEVSRVALDGVKETMSQLSDRELMILTERLGLDNQKPRTLGEVGQKVGLTRERVRQIEAATLVKLKRAKAIDVLVEKADFSNNDAQTFAAYFKGNFKRGEGGVKVAKSLDRSFRALKHTFGDLTEVVSEVSRGNAGMENALLRRLHCKKGPKGYTRLAQEFDIPKRDLIQAETAVLYKLAGLEG